MANRYIHSGYDIYIGDELVKTKAHITVLFDSATLRISGTATSPEALEFTEVEQVSNTRVNREHVLVFTATDGNGNPVTITAIKAGCGCGGKR